MKIYLLGKRTIATAIIVSAISGLIFFFKYHNIDMDEKIIWQLYYEIQKVFGKYLPENNQLQKEILDQLNRKLIEDQELLDYKVHRDIDYSLNEYERLEREHQVINMKNQNILQEIQKSKYTENQKQILKDAVYYEFADGTMGIRGAWVAPDHREIDLE